MMAMGGLLVRVSKVSMYEIKRGVDVCIPR